MNKYLSTAKKSFEDILKNIQNYPGVIHLILGNTSCDLDSCISSIVLAWTKHKTKSHELVENNSVFVPVMNIKRSEFRLRTEINFMFNDLNIPSQNLVFRDECFPILFQTFQHQPKKLKITLVDHHVLLSCDNELEEFIVEIVDHRIRARDIPDHISTNIALVGSCSTLVAEIMMKSIKEEKMSDISDEVKTMVLGTILVDTNNLSPQAGKATPRDIAIVKELRASLSDSEVLRLYEGLECAKYSVAGLTTMDLLLKDPKWIEGISGTIMFSTIHENMQDFIKRPDTQNVISDHCKKGSFVAWISLFPQESKSHPPYKPLIIWSLHNLLRKKMVGDLLLCSDLKIKEAADESLPSNDFQYVRMYNVQRTRKQVLPVVNDLLQKLNGSFKQ